MPSSLCTVHKASFDCLSMPFLHHTSISTHLSVHVPCSMPLCNTCPQANVIEYTLAFSGSLRHPFTHLNAVVAFKRHCSQLTCAWRTCAQMSALPPLSAHQYRLAHLVCHMAAVPRCILDEYFAKAFWSTCQPLLLPLHYHHHPKSASTPVHFGACSPSHTALVLCLATFTA